MNPIKVNCLGLDVILAFDNDEAGRKGQERAAQTLLDFQTLVYNRWRVLPLYGHVWNACVRARRLNLFDVEEELQETLNHLASRADVLLSVEDFAKNFDVDELTMSHLQRIKKSKNELDKKFSERLNLHQDDMSSLLIDDQIESLQKNIKKLQTQRRLTRDVKSGKPSRPSLEAIRAIPITDILAITPNKPIPCLWHKEKTPSLRLHPTKNFVKCFGCGKHASIIDVYMAQNDCDVKEAVHNLSRLVV